VVDIRAVTAHYAGMPGLQISVQNFPGVAGLPDPKKIFEKYYRSPGAHRQTGSGLGLYLVHSFSALLGGHVTYEVAQEQARFTLWIPC
jgi:signal transduction histidine kinase